MSEDESSADANEASLTINDKRGEKVCVVCKSVRERDDVSFPDPRVDFFFGSKKITSESVKKKIRLVEKLTKG